MKMARVSEETMMSKSCCWWRLCCHCTPSEEKLREKRKRRREGKGQVGRCGSRRMGMKVLISKVGGAKEGMEEREGSVRSDVDNQRHNR